MKYESYAKNSIDQVQEELKTSITQGLSGQDVVDRQATFGLHQIQQSAFTYVCILW